MRDIQVIVKFTYFLKFKRWILIISCKSTQLSFAEFIIKAATLCVLYCVFLYSIKIVLPVFYYMMHVVYTLYNVCCVAVLYFTKQNWMMEVQEPPALQYRLYCNLIYRNYTLFDEYFQCYYKHFFYNSCQNKRCSTAGETLLLHRVCTDKHTALVEFCLSLSGCLLNTVE